MIKAVLFVKKVLLIKVTAVVISVSGLSPLNELIPGVLLSGIV